MKFTRLFFDMLNLLMRPNKIGFIQGHSYLENKHFGKLKDVLDSPTSIGIMEEYEQTMSSLIGSGYGVSFAAGRMAFYVLMKALKIGEGDEVILPGFTCSVMPNAVWRTGATPIYADISPGTFGSDVEAIKTKISLHTKLIVAQHTFGIPCNIPEIVELGRRHNIFVLEDCAITFDSIIEGVKVGNWGDAAIFSTDHTKPLNTLIGGFLYTKNRSIYKEVKNISNEIPHIEKDHQKRLFKRLLYERKNYTPKKYPRTVLKNNIKIVVENLGIRHPATFFESDYTRESSGNTDYPYPAKMPPFLAQLGLFEAEHWKIEKKRRKELLKSYINIMLQLGYKKYLPAAYFNNEIEIIPLRLIFTHPDSQRILKRIVNDIDVNWIWFRAPIICAPKGPENLGYKKGSCPVSEKVGMNVINIPCVVPDGWEEHVTSIFRKALHGEN